MNRQRKSILFIRSMLHRIVVVIGAVTLTLVFFLVLPLMQTLAKPPTEDLMVQRLETATLEAPPEALPEVEEPEEPEPEEEPPQLDEPNFAPLSIDQLEIALAGGVSDGVLTNFFETAKLPSVVTNKEEAKELFSFTDLDQKPRAVHQPGPIYNNALRKKAPGRVEIIFIVDQQGRVKNPLIHSSPDPVFDQPALNCVKKWRFEPGKRNGQPVEFRMKVPITFPKG